MQVEKVIYVSTDKAADPSNTYGMTKAIGEKLMVHANMQTKKTKFICVRGGNVLGRAEVWYHFLKTKLKNLHK